MKMYKLQQKDVIAFGYYKANKFYISKGSTAVNDSDICKSLRDTPNRITIRNKLKTERKIKEISSKYHFLEDVPFNSPSEAASIILGSMRNGKKDFGIN